MSRRFLRTLAALVVVAAVVVVPEAGSLGDSTPRVRVVKFWYRAHNDRARPAYVLLPAWYGRGRNPPIPLVISPHGRGVHPLLNLRRWGNLPAIGRFAVVSPGGQGRVLPLHSWGFSGQIADLAKMPELVRLTLPWLRIARGRIYAFGTSMGGQETLLLVARYPGLLAGAAAFDPPTNFAQQYNSFGSEPCNRRCVTRHGRIGTYLRGLARKEVGGPPWEYPARYAWRSPIRYVRAIAHSGVPLQLWWSRTDRFVSANQPRRLFVLAKAVNPSAPIAAFSGEWLHTKEMRPQARLPAALVRFRLLSPGFAP